jgi:hypothetical protein
MSYLQSVYQTSLASVPAGRQTFVYVYKLWGMDTQLKTRSPLLSSWAKDQGKLGNPFTTLYFPETKLDTFFSLICDDSREAYVRPPGLRLFKSYDPSSSDVSQEFRLDSAGRRRWWVLAFVSPIGWEPEDARKRLRRGKGRNKCAIWGETTRRADSMTQDDANSFRLS